MSIRIAGADPLGLPIDTSDVDVICASTSARWRTEPGKYFRENEFQLSADHFVGVASPA